ncbi:MAG: hypothetical protein Q9225_008046, partial [Loekoesia sp. 1 TL-2023]
LHFSHPHVQNISFPQPACFRFLAILETVNVPLYLAAGPSLDVWTDTETTREWLTECLLEEADDDENRCQPSWWDRPGRQSQYGILLGVQSGHDGGAGTGLRITEVLLYAATTLRPSQQGYAPPSPPASSSPSSEHRLDRAAPTVRMHALPLSSEIFKVLNHAPTTIHSFANSTNEGFYFPPSLPDPPSRTDEVQARKRPKLETLFQDATQNRRIQKKKGGEGAAKAMAGRDDKTTASALPSLALPGQIQAKDKASLVQAPRNPLLRASTTGSITSLRSTTPSNARPQSSHRPTLTHGQRSSLHRVESALSPSVDGTISPIPEDSNNNIEQQNKNSLSRIIMAGMRMYGFQPQRKKSVGSVTQVLSTDASVTAAGQDEYKAVYHQTFKATSFVFRKHWARTLLGQDLLRDAVDGFLGKFCQDPFAIGGADEGMLGAELSFQKQRSPGQARVLSPGAQQGNEHKELEIP